VLWLHPPPSIRTITVQTAKITRIDYLPFYL
jgi:hypothetical protein